jgi:hypothetical protein
MGRNFSFLIKELYRYILEDIFERKSDFTITDNNVMCVILLFKKANAKALDRYRNKDSK